MGRLAYYFWVARRVMFVRGIGIMTPISDNVETQTIIWGEVILPLP